MHSILKFQSSRCPSGTKQASFQPPTLTKSPEVPDTESDMSTLAPTEIELTEMGERLRTVRGAMQTENVDLLIISSMEDIFYLSHFQTVGGCIQCLLVTQQHIHIFTRELEVTNANFRSHIPASFYNEAQDPVSTIIQYVSQQYSFKTVGLQYNSDRLTYHQMRHLETGLQAVSADVSFTDTSNLISK